MCFSGDRREWYFVLVEEWLVPTESGREVLPDTYDTLDDAQKAAIEHLENVAKDFSYAINMKMSAPSIYNPGGLMCMIDPAEGHDEEWYDCVKIVPIPYGIRTDVGFCPEVPKGLE